MKTFVDKPKLRKSTAPLPAVQEMLKGVLQSELKAQWLVTRNYMKK